MKGKKIIALGLCLGLLASNLIPAIAGGSIKDNLTGIKNMIYGKKPPEIKLEEITKETPEKVPDYIIKSRNSGITASLVNAETPHSEVNPPVAKGAYNLDKADITWLMTNGYSIEEILKADKTGGQILYSPIELLKRMKKEKKTLQQLKTDILKDRKTKRINELKTRYPREFNTMQAEKMPDNIKVYLLRCHNLDKTIPLGDMIKAYKKSGIKGVAGLIASKTPQESAGAKSLATGGTQKIDQLQVLNLMLVSKERNVPLNKLVESLQREKSEGKGVK